MEQADINLISSLADDLNLDTAWELRAVTAFTKAAPEHRAYIRGHSHKRKQVDLLNELMQGAAAGPGSQSTGAGGATSVEEVSFSSVRSTAWKRIRTLVGVSLVPTSEAPLTAPPANDTMPFTWEQSTESSTTNRTAAMEYLRDILGTPAGQAYIDCASTKTLLSCQLPGTGYSLRGSADIAICTSVAVEGNIPATGLHVLFEVKQTKDAFNTFQLAAKLLAAHVWTSGLQPIAVLTDLMDGWCLMWAAAEKELKMYTCRDRVEAVGILRAFLDKDVLSADSTHIVHPQQQDAAASGRGAAETEAEAGGLLKRRRLRMGAGSGAGADVANLNDLLDFGGDLGLGEADLHQLRSRMQLEALLHVAAPVFRAAAAADGSSRAEAVAVAGEEEEAAFPAMCS